MFVLLFFDKIHDNLQNINKLSLFQVRPPEEIGETSFLKGEVELTTLVLRRTFQKSKTGIARLKTKGQPLVVQHLVQPRVGSASAKPRTLKSRCILAERFVRTISGNTTLDYLAQKKTELKREENVINCQ